MNLTDYRKKRDLILEKLSTDALPFPEDRAEQAKRRQKAKEDYFYFFNTYLPHYADNGFADFHREMITSLENRPEVTVPTAIAAPRGFAKSTIVTFGYVLWSILFKTRRFIIIVSENEDLSGDMVEFIKLELENNERILQDFGRIMAQSGEKNNFVANGIRIFARGRKQMMRGFKYRQHRPDLIILDDIEKEEVAENPAVVLKTLKVITEGIYPSLAPGGNLFIVGTIIKKRSVLGEILLSDKEPYNKWKRKVYRSIDTINGKEISLWEDRFSVKNLQEIRKNIGTVAFYKEYQNQPQEDETAVFQEDWIRYYRPSDISGKQLSIASFIDPSVGCKESGDYKALITVGLDRKEMKYYVLNCWIKHASIDRMLAATYRVYDSHHPFVIGIEANGFQSVLVRDYERQAKEYGQQLPLRKVNHKNPKEERIMRLSPLVERSLLLFPKDATDDTKILIEQLIYFPTPSVHDDAPDALEGAVDMLSLLSRDAKIVTGRKRASRSIWKGY